MVIAYAIAVTDKTLTDQTHILKVEQDSHDGLLVTFSDGTRAGYVVEELLMLRPHRERVEKCLGSDPPLAS